MSQFQIDWATENHREPQSETESHKVFYYLLNIPIFLCGSRSFLCGSLWAIFKLRH